MERFAGPGTARIEPCARAIRGRGRPFGPLYGAPITARTANEATSPNPRITVTSNSQIKGVIFPLFMCHLL